MKKAQLDELQKQIDAVWESVRMEAADKIEQTSEHFAYKGVAESVREDNLYNYLDW